MFLEGQTRPHKNLLPCLPRFASEIDGSGEETYKAKSKETDGRTLTDESLQT